MKAGKKMMVVAAVLAASALVLGGESYARGGAGGGAGIGNQTRMQTKSQSQTVRPEGSQRRDGSFLSTGTTANGSTTRPTNGRGVMDGSGLTTTP